MVPSWVWIRARSPASSRSARSCARSQSSMACSDARPRPQPAPHQVGPGVAQRVRTGQEKGVPDCHFAAVGAGQAHQGLGPPQLGPPPPGGVLRQGKGIPQPPVFGMSLEKPSFVPEAVSGEKRGAGVAVTDACVTAGAAAPHSGGETQQGDQSVAHQVRGGRREGSAEEAGSGSPVDASGRNPPPRDTLVRAGQWPTARWRRCRGWCRSLPA